MRGGRGGRRGFDEEEPKKKASWLAVVMGFSLHADTERVAKVRAKLAHELKRDPESHELAAALGLDAAEPSDDLADVRVDRQLLSRRLAAAIAQLPDLLRFRKSLLQHDEMSVSAIVRGQADGAQAHVDARDQDHDLVADSVEPGAPDGLLRNADTVGELPMSDG